MTAVTTAGLLAGLFGSAFVPAARALGNDTASITCAADADVAYQTAADGIVYAPGLSSITCVITTDFGSNVTDVMTFTATGGVTFSSVPVQTPAGANTDNALNWVINPAATSAVAYIDTKANADPEDVTDDTTHTIVVKLPASGTGFLNVFEGTAAAGTERADIEFVVSANAGQVPSGNFSKLSAQCAPMTITAADAVKVDATNDVLADAENAVDFNTGAGDINNNGLVAAGGTYCTSSTGIAAVAAGDSYWIQVRVRDYYNVAVAAAAAEGSTRLCQLVHQQA